MSLFTKQNLINSIGKSLPEGNIIAVDQEAVDLINAILDKVIKELFPKGSSTVLVQLQRRLSDLGTVNDSIFEGTVNSINDDADEGKMQSSTGIPLASINRAIRSHVGKISVPLDTQQYVDYILDKVLLQFLIEAVEEVPLSETKLEGKHIIKFLFETESGRNNPLHRSPIGPLDKSGKKAASKKKTVSKKKMAKSSSKKSGKRCSPKQISVRGFVRDGKKIKSYCRKKSSKK